MTSYNLEGENFTKLHCGECGITFYAPQHWVEVRRDRGDHGKEFHCPNGHCRVWNTSTLDKVRQERDRLKQQTARLEDEVREANHRAELEAKRVAKLKKRASGGTCPCCSRSFSNMSTHMRKQHQEFVAENVVRLKTAKA